MEEREIKREFNKVQIVKYKQMLTVGKGYIIWEFLKVLFELLSKFEITAKYIFKDER